MQPEPGVTHHFIQPQMQLASGDPNHTLAFNMINNPSGNDIRTSINPHVGQAPVTAPAMPEATILSSSRVPLAVWKLKSMHSRALLMVFRQRLLLLARCHERPRETTN